MERLSQEDKLGGLVYGLLSPSGKAYIGQTSESLQTRLCKHRYDAEKGATTAIGKAIRKYGLANLKVFVLADNATKEWRDFYEFLFIGLLKSHVSMGGYNITIGGDGSVGFQHTWMQRLKIGKRQSGRKLSAITRKRMSESGKRWWKTSSDTSARRRINAKNAEIARAACIANHRTQEYRPLTDKQKEVLKRGTLVAASIVRGSKWTSERRAKIQETWRRKSGK